MSPDNAEVLGFLDSISGWIYFVSRAISLNRNFICFKVLLNLARVMLNLQYWDDALKLTVWSLDKTDKNAWQQHFTLGEIFKVRVLF